MALGISDGISALSGIGYDIAGSGYRCVLLGGKSVAIEGIKLVALFTPDSVELLLKKGRLLIKGEGMKLATLSPGYVCISGKILSISTE